MTSEFRKMSIQYVLVSRIADIINIIFPYFKNLVINVHF